LIRSARGPCYISKLSHGLGNPVHVGLLPGQTAPACRDLSKFTCVRIDACGVRPLLCRYRWRQLSRWSPCRRLFDYSLLLAPAVLLAPLTFLSRVTFDRFPRDHAMSILPRIGRTARKRLRVHALGCHRVRAALMPDSPSLSLSRSKSAIVVPPAPRSSASRHGHGAHLNCGGMTNPHCGQCSQSNIMMSPTPHGEHDSYEKVPAGPLLPAAEIEAGPGLLHRARRQRSRASLCLFRGGAGDRRRTR
jgi:hypothetical protein